MSYAPAGWSNPYADDVCPGGCPFGLPAGHRIKDHPAFPESPPVGPLQALREALEKLGEYPEQDSEEYAAFRQAKAALESVEEQLAALQRALGLAIKAGGDERLRSERPAVTPEERKCVVCEQPVTEDESFKFLAFDGYYHQGCDFIVEIPEQSTEGKP